MSFVLRCNRSNNFVWLVIHKPDNICKACYSRWNRFEKRRAVKTTERYFSNYLLALKLMLKRKVNGNPRMSNNLKILKQVEEKKKFTEILKVTNEKSTNTKLKIQDIRASQLKDFAAHSSMTFQSNKNMCNKVDYNSIMSHDPKLVSSKDYCAKDKEVFNPTATSKLNHNNELGKDCPQAQDFVTNFIDDCFSKEAPLDTIKNSFLNNDVLQVKMYTKVKQNILSHVNYGNSKCNYDDNVTSSKFQGKLKYDNVQVDTFDVKDVKGKIGDLILIEPFSKTQTELQFYQAHIDVAVTVGLTDEAVLILRRMRKKLPLKDKKIVNVLFHCYNKMLHSLVQKEDWVSFYTVAAWMEEDKFQYNYQTYAAVIECLTKLKLSDELEAILKKVKKMEHSLDGLFTQTLLNENQYKLILDSIRIFYPAYVIAPTKINLYSNCKILNNLFTSHKTYESPLGNESFENIEALVEEQLNVEKQYSVKVDALKLVNSKKCKQSEIEKFEMLNKEWRENIQAAFMLHLKISGLENKNFEYTRIKKNDVFVFLNCLPPETFVNAMIETIKILVEYSGHYSPSTYVLYKHLGNLIYKRYQINKRLNLTTKNNTDKIFNKYCSWLMNPTGPAKNTRQQWQMLLHEYRDGHSMHLEEVEWPDIVKITLGKYLYNIILNETKVRINTGGKERLVPVFYLALRRQRRFCFEEVKCHPVVGKLFRKIGFQTIHFESSQLPMLCPPVPWNTASHGAYLITPSNLIRQRPDLGDKVIDMKKIPTQKLYASFDSLNALQAVPWMVNKPVLEVAIEVFKNGGSEELSVPSLPENENKPIQITEEMSLPERFGISEQNFDLIKKNQNKYGLWCEALYRLSLADHYKDKIFWLPQNFDFRGRVYPIPPLMNHIGSDLYRSIFMFAKGKPLGSTGLNWLKTHVINLRGTHKRTSNKDKLEYANSVLPEILNSAEKPLTGGGWWKEAEDPWQTLATCMEIKKALSNPNPELYICHFPVHQDGSCNGLQHYAALGRDKAGAESVNLKPSSHPQDVYSDVAQIIERNRRKDAANGLKIAQVLDGFIYRKVVKQTIMTTVYGVTLYGARIQIANQLKNIKNFPEDKVWEAANYLTQNTFLSLQEMFKSAKAIQDWLIKCAKVINKNNDYVQWISPLGLPIMQPYGIRPNPQQIKKGQTKSKPNGRKQRNAFPPNFIHSLDSTHMMLTALHCEQENLTFASIHDCFWTHPCSVDVMNRICREQFIILHSQPILHNLSKFFIEFYLSGKSDNLESKDIEALKIFVDVPKIGNFDISEVMNSVYFFS